MNPMLKLVLPIGLGLLAGGLNWFAVKKGPPPRAMAVATAEIKAGDVFKESHFGKLMVPGELTDNLPKTAVPYEHLETLYGRESTRDVKKGDMILWQDSTRPGWELSAMPDEKALPISLEGLSSVPKLIRVGDQIGFLVSKEQPVVKGADAKSLDRRPPDELNLDYIGPFRVLSVGERISRDNSDKTMSPRNGDERVITVAVKMGTDGQIDARTRKLISARYGEKTVGQRIVGIVFDSSRKTQMAAIAAE
jgi:hypothetical protein